MPRGSGSAPAPSSWPRYATPPPTSPVWPATPTSPPLNATPPGAPPRSPTPYTQLDHRRARRSGPRFRTLTRPWVMAGAAERRDPVNEIHVWIDVMRLVMRPSVVVDPSEMAVAKLARPAKVDCSLKHVVRLQRIRHALVRVSSRSTTPLA